ncbi:cytochrome P450 4C1-like [Odontomachus brunneus]|uniref:cytochrome P450 4C1-like n=1 Tax=Odontomachus brunneus TaxID=486640 RepID=UPI0013F21138|nr:cytochrome P450 4C1-like [Odontomachus brunneus]XP_032672298.1 cytochrome P450 4C1-like [Odontomachus brunneus]XP_032672299.1 cytochrome P450 4C1-like [Odontomachus brunneus]XP_032672300.1 cytochrome P450 4C1-like [Odontomachus brunneus]XP_032672301.1 cytochrome P450 4C1-like [Odontomachus brunneus]
MDIVFLVLGTLCLIGVYIISLVRYDYTMRQKVKNIPGFKTYPLIGHAIKLIRMNDIERLKWFLTLPNEFKDGIFVQFIGSKPIVNIYKPEFLEVIFPSTINIEKGVEYKLLTPWLGYGLLTSTGAQWFHDRRLIGPTFHFSILDQFAIIISEKADILIKCLEKEIAKCPEKAIDIFPFIINAALDIICETAMGVDVRAQEVVTKYSSTVHRSSQLTTERLLQPWYWVDWLYYLMPVGKEYKALLDAMHKFTKKVIVKRKIARQSGNDHTEMKTEDNIYDIGKQKKKAFLDLLLDQNEKDDAPLNEDELRAQVDTFMFEGHDTTAVAITWTLFCLGNNLEHQEKVHEELEQVFKNTQTPASVKELSQLKYLERVIKETLRLYPSVPFITRKLAEDVKLGDYTIPADITVALPIMLVHRDPEVWPDPTKFDPDRFLPENSKHRNSYAYVPFSAGPRNCIGQRFALLEEKIVLTAILRKWRVKSVKTQVSFAGSLILRPREEIFLHFTPKK